MIAAGIGNACTVGLGGKMSMPSLGLQGQPREVTGRVKLIHNGQYRNQGPAGTGVLCDQGPTVVLDTGKVEIVVISRPEQAERRAGVPGARYRPNPQEVPDAEVPRALPRRLRGHGQRHHRVRGYWRLYSDYSQLTFKNVRRPIYPMDTV